MMDGQSGNGLESKQPGSPDPKEQILENQGPDEATDQNWEQLVERSPEPVAVMFYSPTCAFCHQMEPHFLAYSQEYRGVVRFVRLNVLTARWISERYGVRSTPTFGFFCSGRQIQTVAGAVYPAILGKIIDEVLIRGKECARNSTLIDYEITGYG